MDFIPEKSEIQIEDIEVFKDGTLKSLIKDLGIKHLIPGFNKKEQGGRKPRQ